MSTLQRLAHGELPLSVAFWHWAVLGGLLVNALTSVLFLALLAADRPVAALLLGYGLSVSYNVLVTVGVWRSAGRHEGDPRHAQLARVVTVIAMVLLSVT